MSRPVYREPLPSGDAGLTLLAAVAVAHSPARSTEARETNEAARETAANGKQVGRAVRNVAGRIRARSGATGSGDRKDTTTMAGNKETRLRNAAERAVRLWGPDWPLRHMRGECNDLVAAISQHERGLLTQGQLALEIAKVVISAAQARYILGQQIDACVAAQLEHLEARIARDIEARGGLR